MLVVILLQFGSASAFRKALQSNNGMFLLDKHTNKPMKSDFKLHILNPELPIEQQIAVVLIPNRFLANLPSEATLGAHVRGDRAKEKEFIAAQNYMYPKLIDLINRG